MTEAEQCYATIEGPDVGHGRRIVAWRRQCHNRTTDPSGYCRFHRRGGCQVGETAEMHALHVERERA